MSSFRRDRRVFLLGALASGTVSLASGTLRDKLPGPTAGGALRIAVGNRATGLFDLLARLYATRSGTTVEVNRAGESAVAQLNYMRQHAGSAAGSKAAVDVLAVDVVHMSVLAEEKCIVPIPDTQPIDFLPAPLATCHLSPSSGAAGYYGLPFSTNVGMLFRRAGDDAAAPVADGLGDLLSPGSRRTWTAQLSANPGEHGEGLLCNFLEHVLAVDGCASLLTPHGRLVDDVDSWNTAVKAIRTAIDRDRLEPYPDDVQGLKLFNSGRVQYMRNWPTFLHRAAGLENVQPSELVSVGAGILGGMNLSISARARDESQAWAFIEFLASPEVQKIVALYGYPPTFTAVYDDPDLKTTIPHLGTLKESLRKAKMRPAVLQYDQLSSTVVDVVTRCLGPDRHRITETDLEQWQRYY